MKRKTLTALAAAFAVAAIPALAQEQGESAPAGLSEDQAIELARIVNAAGDETAEAIATAVKDVLSNAEDAASVVGDLTAALSAAVVAQGGKDVPRNLADIVAAVAASVPGDAASALAERATAVIVVATSSRSFSELVPEDIAAAVADAADDPLSVITARDAADARALFLRILAILTPDTYTTHSDIDALFILANRSDGTGTGVGHAPSKKPSHSVRPSPTPTGLR